MSTSSIHSNGSAAQMRAAVGAAGMFVVGCFGLALFFTGERSQAAEAFAHTEESAALVQVADVR